MRRLAALGLTLAGMLACNLQPAEPLRPFDLHYTATDLNGYPLNPLLGEQFNNPQGPGRLAQKIAGKPELPCIPAGNGLLGFSNHQSEPANWYSGPNPCTRYHVTVHGGSVAFGHVNWFPVTVQGTIYFESHSGEGADDDYSFNIATRDNALGTLDRTLNGDGKTALVHSELDSDEAIDPLLDNVDEDDPFWWKQFKNAVDNDASKPFPGGQDGMELIAIGLYNLECYYGNGHTGCGVELHPLYIMAIHLQADPRADRWALFAYNHGNQGYTGTDRIGLYPALGQNEKFNGFDDQYSVLLPPPPGASGAQPVFTHEDVRIAIGDDDTVIPAGNYFGSTYLPQKGEELDFRLPDPDGPQKDNHWVIMGDITLDWGLTVSPPPPGPAPSDTPTATLAPTATATPAACKATQPTLLSPANASINPQSPISLDWSKEQCATRYELQVREGSTNGPLVVDESKLTKSKFKADGTAGNTYYWRVKACDLAGCTDWTEWWSFKLGETTTCQPPPECVAPSYVWHPDTCTCEYIPG